MSPSDVSNQVAAGRQTAHGAASPAAEHDVGAVAELPGKGAPKAKNKTAKGKKASRKAVAGASVPSRGAPCVCLYPSAAVRLAVLMVTIATCLALHLVVFVVMILSSLTVAATCCQGPRYGPSFLPMEGICDAGNAPEDPTTLVGRAVSKLFFAPSSKGQKKRKEQRFSGRVTEHNVIDGVDW